MIPRIVAGLAKIVSSKDITIESFKHLLIEPEVAYATDNYMLVKVEYEPKHDVEDYPIMQEGVSYIKDFKPFLLHRDNVKNLSKTKIKKTSMPILFDTLAVIKEQNNKQTVLCNTDLQTVNVQTAKQDCSYPDGVKNLFDTVMNDKKKRTYVTVSVDLMQKLFSTLNEMGFKTVEMGVVVNDKKAAVTFTGETIDDEKLTAILLPFVEK